MAKVKRAAGRPQEREPDMSTWQGRLLYKLHQAAMEKNLSPKDIAEIISTKYNLKTEARTVNSWWGGRSVPEVSRLRVLSLILEVSIDSAWE